MDNMHLDDSNSPEILFGSTRSFWRPNMRGTQVYIWKVELDTSTHDPVPSTVFVAKLSDAITDAGCIAALKQNLVNGNVHGFIYRGNREIYYFVYDWTYSNT